MVIRPYKRKEVRNNIAASYQEYLQRYPRENFRRVVVAHSFGSYAFFDMLQTLRFDEYPDAIILSGSIINRKSEIWSDLKEKGVTVFIEYRKSDLVVRAAPLLWFTGAKYVGWSGLKGVSGGVEFDGSKLNSDEFVDALKSNINERIFNISYPNDGHSDGLEQAHMEKRLLPMIQYRPFIS